MRNRKECQKRANKRGKSGRVEKEQQQQQQQHTDKTLATTESSVTPRLTTSAHTHTPRNMKSSSYSYIKIDEKFQSFFLFLRVLCRRWQLLMLLKPNIASLILLLWLDCVGWFLRRCLADWFYLTRTCWMARFFCHRRGRRCRSLTHSLPRSLASTLLITIFLLLLFYTQDVFFFYYSCYSLIQREIQSVFSCE